MKKRLLLAALVAASFAQPLKSHADDWFRLSWHGTVYATGANGQVIAKTITERDFVNNVAVNNGLDPRTLVFVYRPHSHDTVVVRPSDGWFADIIQMEYKYTQVSNTNGTKIVRQAYLFDEHRGQIGSVFGTETARYDANFNMLSDSFHGTFQYAVNDNDPYSDIPAFLQNYSPPYIFSGTFITGARVKDLSEGK